MAGTQTYTGHVGSVRRHVRAYLQLQPCLSGWRPGQAPCLPALLLEERMLLAEQGLWALEPP